MKQPYLIPLFLALLGQSGVLAQGDAEDVVVPQNREWLAEVDMSSVPDLPLRPVGSGICEDVACDGPENDECFESCGNTPGEEDIYGCPRDHTWALTFDDGPSEYTHELLDLLEEHDIKATFCVMGSHVVKYPDVLQRAFEAGHQIASHTYSHPHLMSLTNEEIIYEMKATEKEIEKAIGIKPKYVRPPFGEADNRVKALLRSMGYKILLWNVDPTDYDVYMLPDASKKIRGAFKSAASGVDTGLNPHEDPGFISLQHDLYNQSIAQVPHVIKYLKDRGYSFSTAAECLDDNEPHELLDEELIAAQSAKTSNATVSASSSASDNASASTSATSSAFDKASNNKSNKAVTTSGANTVLVTKSGFALAMLMLGAMLF